MIRPLAAVVAIAAIFPVAASAQSTAEQLSQALKPIIIEKIPTVLFEQSDNWGHQAMVPVGLKWVGLRSYVQKSPRNHGEWKRIIVTAQDPKRTLDLKIHSVKTIDDERQSFKVFLTFQMGAHYEQQNWANGVKLWAGHVRARAQVRVDLDCENTMRLVFEPGPLPDMVMRMRVTNARVGYDKLVCEHINGIGGTGAKVIGEALHNMVNRVQPSLERDMLARAGETIVKAGDTREVRVGFSTIFKSK